jgi:hypothetical protein
LKSELKVEKFIRNFTNESYETTSCAGALFARARDRTVQPFTQGKKQDGDEGSLSLTREHNWGLEHQPAYLGFQYRNTLRKIRLCTNKAAFVDE